jgi:hypothetical protein
MEGDKGALEDAGKREDAGARVEDARERVEDFKMPILPKHTPIWSFPSSPAGRYSGLERDTVTL